MSLRLAEEKTKVCHITEGFDFLGWRIQRREQRNRPGQRTVYTFASKKSFASIMVEDQVVDPTADPIERWQTCCAG